MSELIDRQAAIDIFDDYNVSVENGELEAYRRDRKRLCELPTIQPEERTEKRMKTHACDLISRQEAIDAIVQCTNCGDEDTLRGYVLKHSLDNGWTGGILEALDAVKDLPTIHPEPQWIPVSERLPETGVEVLTYDEALNYIEIQTVSDRRWENQRGDWQDLDDIAAWMPLPEAYKPNNE